MAALFSPLPIINATESNRKNWIPDHRVQSCMSCQVPFGYTIRKHHCRNCGHIVCYQCSPRRQNIVSKQAMMVRVCNNCYTAVDRGIREWSKVAEVENQPNMSAGGFLHIGQLYIKVVEAIALPLIDALAKDPFVRVTLTGNWSHGQEWKPEFRTVRKTKCKHPLLHPRWDESFVFNVFAPGAMVLLEVFHHRGMSKVSKIGQVSLRLQDLMDQQKHNLWLDLQDENGETIPSGRIHILAQYEFSAATEALSYFVAEPEFCLEPPQFRAATLYSHFWCLMDDLLPLLDPFWHILPILEWQQPTRSAIWMSISLFICYFINWVPVLLHVLLLYVMLQKYLVLYVMPFYPKMLPVDRHHSECSETHMNQTPREYSLPSGLHHITDKLTRVTMNAETKSTLQSLQNTMAIISSYACTIRHAISWQDSQYTSKIFAVICISCILHILVPNRYLLSLFILYLFTMWTVPFITILRWSKGSIYAVQSILHQRRLQSQPSTIQMPASTTKVNRPPTSERVARKAELFSQAAIALSKGLSDSPRMH